MHVPTYAIIIGISHYQSKHFPNLPAAHADALHFARSLKNWGIPESHISLISRPCESEAIVHCIQRLSSLTTPFQLIFYFCGHGYRTPDPFFSKSYLICSDSELNENSCLNALDLEELLQSLYHLNFTNLYLFIDACHLRLNTIFHPEIKEKIERKNNLNRKLFCLLSSGLYSSYENIEENYGYFTEALLRALVKIRQSDRSPTALFQHIQEELHAQELHEPEMYNIGTHLIDFFPPLKSYMSNSQLIRQNVIADLQDLLILHRNKALCVTGPTGSGKTTLSLQFSSEPLECYHVPLNRSLQNLSDQLTRGFFESQILRTDSDSVSLVECLDYLQQQMPDTILIFDEINEKNVKNLKDVLAQFIERSLRMIFLSPNPYYNKQDEQLQNMLVEYSIPPLTYEETKIWTKGLDINTPENSIEFIHLISKGNPLRLKQALNQSINSLSLIEIPGVKRVIAAIKACGLFMDAKLFMFIFDLNPEAIAYLEKNELIYLNNGCFYPHSLLLKIIEADEIEIDPALTLRYWFYQFEYLPNHFDSALNFILTLKNCGYKSKFESKVLQAFQVLYQHRPKGLNVLKEAVDIFLSPPVLTPSSIYLAEVLIEHQAVDLAKKLLGLNSSFADLNQQSRISYSHLLWRSGLFYESIEETTLLINTLSSFSQKIWCHMHRGASHYFLGNWNEAQRDFSLIHEQSQEPKYIGLSRCLLGTISGLRGIDIEKSQLQIDSGIQILMQEQDLSKAWVGFNNLGEIMWKKGDLSSASYYLQKAHEIAQEASNPSILLETLRNLLQLELRTISVNRLRMNKLIEKIEKTLEMTHEYYELFQVYNTLCTVYFYLGDYVRSRYFLNQAIPLTIPSKEYHIYTLANLALHFKAFKLENKSRFYLDRAYYLAAKGNNQLAKRQIESDFTLCFNS